MIFAIRTACAASLAYEKKTGVGETTCAATPSASMSASRTDASQQSDWMRRNSLPFNMITASVSVSRRSQGVPGPRSGQPLGT